MSENDFPETFSLSLKGAGIDIQREVGADKLAIIISVMMGIDQTDNLGACVPNVVASAALDKVSLREFLDQTKASTKSDQIVAIGHYMAIHERRDTFTRDDIKSRFQSAREPLPANFPRDFSSAVGKGMIAEDHAKAGLHYVTKTGMKAVERCFAAST